METAPAPKNGAMQLPYEGVFNEQRYSTREPKPPSSHQRWRAKAPAEVRSS